MAGDKRPQINHHHNDNNGGYMSEIPERMIRKLSDKEGDIDTVHLKVLFNKCSEWTATGKLYPWQWQQPWGYPLDDSQKLSKIPLIGKLIKRREERRGMSEALELSPDIDCKHCYLIYEEKEPTCFNLEQSNEQHLDPCPGDCSIRKPRGDEDERVQTLQSED